MVSGAGSADFGGLEVWRGGVNTWECDEMGHLNVRFYVARAMEGLVGLASALGLVGAFHRNAEATLQVTDQHIRFMREARPRAALHMMGGLLDMTETEARFLQLLIHSGTGEVAASFQTTVAHVTARDLRPFAWSARSRDLAEGVRLQTPPGVGPRSLDLAPSQGRASLVEARRLDLIPLGSGAIGAADCDVFGRMRPEFLIGRISDGIPALGAALGPRNGLDSPAPARMGGAVLEYRIAYLAWPLAGDRFEVRSGLVGVDERTTRYVHWMLDPDSGRAWGSALAVAVGLDLDARKIVPLDPEARRRLAARINPELSF
jgi:acyl-CoA thioester hydrolase